MYLFRRELAVSKSSSEYIYQLEDPVMVEVVTFIWAAFSLFILCLLIYLFAKRKIGKITFISFLIFVIIGAAGFIGWLQAAFQAVT